MDSHDKLTPLNTHERYLYNIIVRLDAMCDMLNSLITHYAEQNKVATTKKTVTTRPATRKKGKE